MTYDRTLIVIRERSFLELLDLAFLVVRDRPVALGLAALAGIAPFAALNVWLLSELAFPRALWIFLLLMEIPWATAPLTRVLGDLMFEARPRLSRIVRTMAVSFPALFITQFMVRGLLFVLIIGYVLVPSRFCFLNEVVLLEPMTLKERLNSWRALKRGAQICRGFESELLVRSMGQILLGLTFALCFQAGAETVGSVMAGGELTWDQPGLADLGGLLFQAGVWIAVAFFAVVRFLSYIDRRIRLEGWEIELRLRGVGRALEESPQ
jgi:hypothetical protein